MKNLVQRYGKYLTDKNFLLKITTFGSAEGSHTRKYSNKFGISLT